MKEELLLVLNREDLLPIYKNTPIHRLSYYYFNIDREKLNSASMVIFYEDGETLILKNRYSETIGNC